MGTIRLAALSALCALVLVLAGCGGGGGGGGGTAAPTGSVQVSLTDAPTTDLDHVWVTVKEIRFHRSELCDDPADGGWLRYPLAVPVTIDLATLQNGRWDTVWNGIVLPVGNYQQIRVILAGTADPLTPSALAKGLDYNNQVDDNTAAYPLVIPAAQNGIKLVGSFQVTTWQPLHIVIDFDITHDVVETGSGKYILKPRLKYQIVADPQTAAITGTVLRPDGTPFANYTGVTVIIKAEAPETITFADTSSGTVMAPIRGTRIRGDGTFALFPLPAGAGKTYDLVISGDGVRNMVLRDVPAVPGTDLYTPSMFDLRIRLGGSYLVSAQAVNADTDPYEPVRGASVGFYQTLPGIGEIPYQIRFRHVSPLFGTFGNFPLASGNIMAGTFDPGAYTQTFTAVEPVEGSGSYAAYATAPFFWPAGPRYYSPETTFQRFVLSPMAIATPPDCDLDDDGESESAPDKGYYVVSGGLVVDHVRKVDLENGAVAFESTDSNGKDLKSHAKGDKVNLDHRKPKKTKINFKK